MSDLTKYIFNMILALFTGALAILNIVNQYVWVGAFFILMAILLSATSTADIMRKHYEKHTEK